MFTVQCATLLRASHIYQGRPRQKCLFHNLKGFLTLRSFPKRIIYSLYFILAAICHKYGHVTVAIFPQIHHYYNDDDIDVYLVQVHIVESIIQMIYKFFNRQILYRQTRPYLRSFWGSTPASHSHLETFFIIIEFNS